MRLALWDPSPVDVGAVGYLERPRGRFITLFNALHPRHASDHAVTTLHPLGAYGHAAVGKTTKELRTSLERGRALVNGILRFRSKRLGTFEQNVERRYSLNLHTGRKESFLKCERSEYQYFKDRDLLAARAWFWDNINAIVQIYGSKHKIQREDIFLGILRRCAELRKAHFVQ